MKGPDSHTRLTEQEKQRIKFREQEQKQPPKPQPKVIWSLKDSKQV